MTIWIKSTNGRNPRRLSTLPETVWVGISDNQGSWISLDVDNAAEHGFLPLTETPQPDADHAEVLTAAAGAWVQSWVHDPALANRNADDAAREVDRSGLRDDFAKAKLERAQMTEGDKDFQNRWKPVDETRRTVTGEGTDPERIAALEKAVNQLGKQVGDQAKLVNLISAKLKQGWAVWVRKLRADRDDEEPVP